MISSHRFRLYLLALFILGGFGVLLYRLWGLQINRQEEFNAMLPKTEQALQRIPGPRGRIFDRNGIPLADNKANLEVGLDLAEVERFWKEENSRKPKDEQKDLPKFTWDEKRDPDTDIVRILNQTIFPKLDALSLYIQPTEKMIDDIRLWYRENRGVIPYPYQKALDRSNTEDYRRFAAYAEYANELPGISLRDRSTRIYPLKALAAHVLGYVKAAGREKPPADEAIEWNFFENDDTGIAGVEKNLDAELRGKPGTRVYLKNEHGRLADEIVEKREEPTPGDDVYLTIDARIQTIAEMALREAIYEPGKKGIGRGAVSVIDPNTGEILAMASVPSFDPNIFIPFIRQGDWDALKEDNNPTLPMVSRSLSAFPPGSTFKIVTGIAASMENKAGNTYNCNGSVYYGRAFNCWTVQTPGASNHGPIKMAEAIKRSCNCYFYQCGNAAGIDRIEEVGKMFGIGSKLPIQLNYQVTDVMPGRAWWAQENQGPWTDAKTANISIGQGEVQATPLQMALITGAVAANGKSWQPTLVHHNVKYSRSKNGSLQQMSSEFKPKLSFDLLNLGERSAKAKDLATIRDGMVKVVNDDSGGTGRRARSKTYGIAGKTGTAQKWREEPELDKNGIPMKDKDGKPLKRRIKDNHTWFVAFAPYDAPKIAVCVVIANGKSGGGTAAPVARRVIERSLGLQDGKFHQPVSPLDPAVGHFGWNEMITYEGEEDAGANTNEDPGEPVDTGDEPVAVVKAVPNPDAAAAPRIEDDTRAGTREADVKKRDFKKQSDPD